MGTGNDATTPLVGVVVIMVAVGIEYKSSTKYRVCVLVIRKEGVAWAGRADNEWGCRGTVNTPPR